MSLLSRLVAPAEGEEKLPSHQFMAVLAEYKRGAPGVTLAAIATEFSLSAGEQSDLAFMASLYVADQITREQIHDALLLGEYGIYDTTAVQARILTSATPDLSWVLMQARIDAIRIGLNDFTLSGAAVTAQGSPNMTVAVAKGAVMSNGALRAVTAGNVTIDDADSALSRLDLVVADSNGAKQVRKGTASATPQIGGFQGGDVPLALIYVPPGATSITTDKMMDVRVVRSSGPVTIGSITSPVTFNNTNAQQIFITLTMPNGLFLAGRRCRVQCGGTMLLNSGTPTVTLAIAYGATVMFQDVTGSATSDADRIAWALDFVITAQGNTDQALNGILSMSPVAAKTAPNTGVGDIATTAALGGQAFNGSASVDSDSLDRNIQVAWTMSVANAANEIVMEYALAELV
jgi:hypothetical protein